MSRVLVVGGVAGGASCAARLRRLDESVDIVVFDRGPFVSFANCGLPFYVGDVIEDERALLMASPELFRQRFNITVFTDTEVNRIDRTAQTITVHDTKSGAERVERYDALVLSPGAAPIRPPLPGVTLPGVFAVRSIPDSRAIRNWISTRGARTAIIVGGGFIGLEMAENLVRRGLTVTVLEKLQQVMPPLDPEMAAPIQAHLRAQGLLLHLGGERLGTVRVAELDAARLGGRESRLGAFRDLGALGPLFVVICGSSKLLRRDLLQFLSTCGVHPGSASIWLPSNSSIRACGHPATKRNRRS